MIGLKGYFRQLVEPAKIQWRGPPIGFTITDNMRTNGNSDKTDREYLIYPELLDEDALRLDDAVERADDFDEDSQERAEKVWHSFQTC